MLIQCKICLIYLWMPLVMTTVKKLPSKLSSPVWRAALHTVCKAWRTSWTARCSAGNHNQTAWHGWWYHDQAPSWPQYGNWSSSSQAAPDVQRTQGSLWWTSCKLGSKPTLKKMMKCVGSECLSSFPWIHSLHYSPCYLLHYSLFFITLFTTL